LIVKRFFMLLNFSLILKHFIIMSFISWLLNCCIPKDKNVNKLKKQRDPHSKNRGRHREQRPYKGSDHENNKHRPREDGPRRPEQTYKSGRHKNRRHRSKDNKQKLLVLNHTANPGRSGRHRPESEKLQVRADRRDPDYEMHRNESQKIDGRSYWPYWAVDLPREGPYMSGGNPDAEDWSREEIGHRKYRDGFYR
jgi:hypothetical protein